MWTHYMIMSTKLRFYIGQLLDIYKQAAGSRYGSVDDATSSLSMAYRALRVYLPLQVQLVSFTTSHIISHGVYSIGQGMILMMRWRSKTQLPWFRVGTTIMICIHMPQSTSSCTILVLMHSLEITAHISPWSIHMGLYGLNLLIKLPWRLWRRWNWRYQRW